MPPSRPLGLKRLRGLGLSPQHDIRADRGGRKTRSGFSL